MKKMRPISRIIIAVSSLGLLATYFVPFWFIYLMAPQYPEGLTMKIWLNKLSGDVEIINGLNHYIGMKHIKASMFPEFHYLVYAVAALVVLGLVIAVSGNRKWLLSLIGLLVLSGVAAIYDFYQWGYDYGHNLDPKAPIQVPGFSYQPPVIGHKSLLNFDAYSYPDAGAWITISITGMLFMVWIFEFKRYRRQRKQPAAPSKRILKSGSALAACVALFFLSSCTVNPEPFVLGKDNCSFCKMTIVTPSFGGEILTRKGRIYKFDDLHCLISFLKSGNLKPNEVLNILAVNYQSPHQFIEVSNAVFIQDNNLHSPMSGNIAAFADRVAARNAENNAGILPAEWNTIYKSVTE